MKLHVMFEREPGSNDPCWAIDAVDEYTLDEWNGVYPDEFKKKLDEDPVNRRILVVEVPDNVADMLWPAPPYVEGVTHG